MEYEANRSGKPISLALLRSSAARAIKQWIKRQRTRRILARMSDERLKDIGLTRDEVRRFAKRGALCAQRCRPDGTLFIKEK